MLTDCGAGENHVFSVAMTTNDPPFVSFSPHVVAKYGELERTWQGRPALSLIDHRLRLPVGGATLFHLEEEETNSEESTETFAAVSMSIWGDLFYQLWSYDETPPTATPTHCRDETWLQEALHQEQELQVSKEEWQDSSAPVNFTPLLQYLAHDLPTILCPSCYHLWSTHPSLPSPLATPTQTTPTSSETPPTYQMRCSFCSDRLAPWPSRKYERKLVREGLLEEAKPVRKGLLTEEDKSVGEGLTEEETMATAAAPPNNTKEGVEQLKKWCVFTEPSSLGAGSEVCEEDLALLEGWRDEEDEEEEEEEEEEGSSTATGTPSKTEEKSSSSNTPHKSRSRNRGMGF